MVETWRIPVPPSDADKEAVRLRATKALKAFDRPGEDPQFTRLVRLAASHFQRPARPAYG